MFSQVCGSAGLVLPHIAGLKIWVFSTSLSSPWSQWADYSGHVLLSDGTGISRAKSNDISLFEADFCTIAANILLAEAEHMAKHKVKRQGSILCL